MVTIKVININWEKIEFTQNVIQQYSKEIDSGIYQINGQHYIILNWEDYGCLLQEVSTLRLSFRFWTFENPMA